MDRISRNQDVEKLRMKMQIYAAGRKPGLNIRPKPARLMCMGMQIGAQTP